MSLSMTTDYRKSTGCPEEYLRRIAEAGFTHVHWCHQWNTDFLYSEPEITRIERWLREFGLGLTDLHASCGPEKNWGSLREYEREAGVELVSNRIDMTARLGSDVIIMHLPPELHEEETREKGWDQLFKSLEELRPFAAERGVRIAVENGIFDDIERVFGEFGPDFVGLCYDSGHGNLVADGLDRLERVKDRLISIHIHDNGGGGDAHKIPFSGTVDWERLAGIIASSPYSKWVNLEVSMRNYPETSEEEFLAESLAAAERLASMISERAGK